MCEGSAVLGISMSDTSAASTPATVSNLILHHVSFSVSAFIIVLAPPSVGTKEEAASQEKQVKKKHKATVSQQLAMRHGDGKLTKSIH